MAGTYTKPMLRGHLHQAAFFIALGACAMLMSRSSSMRVFLAMLIYSLSLVGMFGVSALYHRPKWNDHWRVLMKRIDHAAIFVLIAGTGTPICLLALPSEIGFQMLIVIWVASFIGMSKSLFWVHSPKWVSSVLYVVVGWIAVMYIQDIRAVLGFNQLVYLVLGGVVYSLGAIIYAFKWPNPSPKFFGYHELFHCFVIAGAVFHFLVVESLLG